MFIDTRGRQEDIALTNFILEDEKTYDNFLKKDVEKALQLSKFNIG